MMTAYNFKKKFEADIVSGKKRQTIRRLGKRRPPHVGERLYLFVGQRTAFCRRIMETVCTKVTPINIYPLRHAVAITEGEMWRKLSDREVSDLAVADGFPDENEFFNFFGAQCDFGFVGHLIEWAGPEDRRQRTVSMSYAKPSAPEQGTVLSTTECSDVYPTVFCPLSSGA
ncbi:hypothetical protein AGMMS50256_33930 [Betaproteobacteria bacterium]|nr:hypothetical protein AGMMS50256_33930 [Betaproteobacteria bacterium]